MKALLLLNYASLKSIDEVPDFYAHLYRGRAPSPALLEEGLHRFRSLGTADPLGSVTSRLAEALEQRLEPYAGEQVRVFQASKHTYPFIEDAVRLIADAGVTELYSFPTSPLYSRTGTAAYHRHVRKALASLEANIRVIEINHWHLYPGVVQAVSRRLHTALHWISAENRPKTTVLFTAHSQPGTPEANSEFIAAFREMAEAVARITGWEDWRLAYRSAGPPPQRWLGPDMLEVMEEISQDGGKAVVVCDLLSLTENVEAISDCRVSGRSKSESFGLEFAAAEFLNDSSDYVSALVELLDERIRQAPSLSDVDAQSG